jgi:peptide/nickel transport system ATP-binding protein
VSDEIMKMEGIRIVARSADGKTKNIVDGLDLALRRGEVLGLIGESGAGKSTIGLAALAYTRPGCSIASGRLLFAGEDVGGLDRSRRRSLRGRRIAYVAQSAGSSFNPAMSLFQQVCEMPVRHGVMGRAEAKEQAVVLFRELDLPSPETIGNRYPHQVSGGQLQRAMLAMAMSCRPDVLVFDEPTTALDVTTQIEVLVAIRTLIGHHRTAGLYISHDLAVVAQVAHRIMVLRHGHVVELGDAQQILHDPHQDYTRRLVTVRAAAGRSGPKAAPARGEPVISLDRVAGAYGSVRVVEDISFSIDRAETLALVGESGSGKSTVARLVCGLRPPVSGSIRFRGAELAPHLRSRSRDDLRRIQMIYQTPDLALNPRQRIAEILGRPLSFYFSLTPKRIRERLEDLLRLVDLPVELLTRSPGELSGGQQQRICIARALAAEPDLMICDEVTSALDPLVADEILALLGRLQSEMGIAYLFITHDLAVVRRVAHRVAVMRRGVIVFHDTVETAFTPPLHPYVAALLSSVPEMRADWLDDVLNRRAACETL